MITKQMPNGVSKCGTSFSLTFEVQSHGKKLHQFYQRFGGHELDKFNIKTHSLGLIS